VALNFPSSPTIGDVYTDTTSGFSYEWDGTVWKSYTPASSSNIRVLDDISGSFNGSQNTFSLTVLGTALTPTNAQQLRIVLGGVVQGPGTDYTVSGSSISFTTPPTGGLSFSGVSLGPSIPVSVPGDGTVTPAKLSTGGPFWNTNGDLYIAGINTIQTLDVNGSADLSQLNVTGVSTVGIVTGATYYGDGSNLTGVISGVGIATESGLVGSGATVLDFRGAGISTVTVSSGIATVNIEGGDVGINPINYIIF
jgi:hypothetical protein